MSIPQALLSHSSKSPERSSPNRAPTDRDASHWSPPKILSQQLHRFPNGPSKQETPVSRIFCTFLSKFPVNGPPPPPCPPPGSPWREKPHLQGQWLIHSFISVVVPNKEPSHKKRGKILSHHPWSPTWTEGLQTMGCGLIPHGDRLRHCNLYPSVTQPSARYLPPWLG